MSACSVKGGKGQWHDVLDDTCGSRCNLSERMNMRHNIVATLLFLLCSDIKLFWSKVLAALKMRYVTVKTNLFTHQIALHLFECLIWDRKPELLFSNRKIEPQLSPGFEPMLVIKSSRNCNR